MMTPEPADSLLGVCICRLCVPPPLPKKSPKKSSKGLVYSTICVLLVCTHFIYTTALHAFSAATVRSTGCPAGTVTSDTVIRVEGSSCPCALTSDLSC